MVEKIYRCRMRVFMKTLSCIRIAIRMHIRIGIGVGSVPVAVPVQVGKIRARTFEKV